MVSIVIDVLRQGIWASFTGGWYYDPHHSRFINTFHLYLFLLFLCLPVTVYSYLATSLTVWAVYIFTIGFIFVAIKGVNMALHRMYDTTEGIVEDSTIKENIIVDKRKSNTRIDRRGEEEIELQIMNREIKPMTPDEESESSIDFSDFNFPKMLEELRESSTIDLKVDVHRKNSSDSGEEENVSKSSIKAQIDSPVGDLSKSQPLASSFGEVRSTNKPKEATSSNVDCSSDNNPGSSKLCEKSRQYSHSVTLGEGKLIVKNTDPLPARSLQFDCQGNTRQDELNDNTKGMLYWKDKWVNEEEGRKSSCIAETEDDILTPSPSSDMRRPIEKAKAVLGGVSLGSSESEDSECYYLDISVGNRKALKELNTLKASSSDGYEDDDETDQVHSPLLMKKPSKISSSSMSVSDGATIGNHKKTLTSDRLKGHRSADSLDREKVNKDFQATTEKIAIMHPVMETISPDTQSDDSLFGPPISWLFNENDELSSTAGNSTTKMEGSSEQNNSVMEDTSTPGEPMCSKMKGPFPSTSSGRRYGGIRRKAGNKTASRASSSGSNNELSTLLPSSSVFPCGSSSMPLFTRGLTRIDSRSGRARATRTRHRTSILPHHNQPFITPEGIPSRDTQDEFLSYLKQIHMPNLDSQYLHIASSHEDTTEGAIHLFQDENGQWMSYTFNESSVASPITIHNHPVRRGNLIPEDQIIHHRVNPVAMSGPLNADGNSLHFMNSGFKIPEGYMSFAPPPIYDLQRPSSSNLYQIQEYENGSYSIASYSNVTHSLLGMDISSFAANDQTTQNQDEASSTANMDVTYLTLRPPRTRYPMLNAADLIKVEKPIRRFYTFRFTNFFTKKIYWDRLKLLSLLDPNRSTIEMITCVLLAVLVSVFGSILLYMDLYKDVNALIFSFVIAGCHYSLIKSVQPDAASPTHGFNKLVAFNRPVYFIIFCILILIASSLTGDYDQIYIYGVLWDPGVVIETFKLFMSNFMLVLPVVFTLGLFPQINTFLLYFLEHFDVHVFGGNGVTSLKASIYCICRSILAICILFGFAYASLESDSNHLLFSIFISLIVITAYHLSRSSCDPTPIWNLTKKHFWPIINDGTDTVVVDDKNKKQHKEKTFKRKHRKKIEIAHDFDDEELKDPLPSKLQKTINLRLQSDLIVSLVVGIAVFIIHRSSVFSILQPELNPVMWGIASGIGCLLHYIIPQTRKHLPWLCFSSPLIRSAEYNRYEPNAPAKVTWFEMIYLYLGFIEKNIVYPIMFIGCMTSDSKILKDKMGPLPASLVLTLCGLKCLRLSFSHISCQYLILSFCVLFFQLGYLPSETFIVDYFITSIIYYKVYELLLKIKFVMTYIAPWQITWGSAFHAFAQPFSLPHTALMFAQAILAALISAPLYPFLGSAIFLCSYPRPMKFWERDYNTRRVDHSNTKMSSHLERNLGADDNNLNSIFYEHLTRSLQHSLCGDVFLGRWGEVSPGDCYVLASDYLNCLIHIVELGNGLLSFQMRGLEFRGTYCQQREVEAITDDLDDDDGCCCCKPGHLPSMLSLNAAFNQRWLAWEVTTSKYILEGYSISDNAAASMLQVFDFRKMLISYYVKSIIFYTVSSPKLNQWLQSETIRDSLEMMRDKNYVDVDPIFNSNIDEDFDGRFAGISRNSFCNVYLNWIKYCHNKRERPICDLTKESHLVTLCLALSLLGRRTLGTASHATASSVEFFLYGIHALFKGDFRIVAARDEWVFSDMDLLRKVVSPAIRMSLKLHQDHFMAPDEYESLPSLYGAIWEHDKNLVISHEGDPLWRKAVLSGRPSLLALRRVMDDGADEYKIIMLNKRYLSFRLIKLNKECVRGLWAGQQQELIFLRNRNPERGSIQNAKQALRNIINSSCDQPIGYPIFVSPLTTSYVETNEQIRSYLGGPISLGAIRRFLFGLWGRARKRCVEGCSSGSSMRSHDDSGINHERMQMTTLAVHSMHSNIQPTTPHSQSMETSLVNTGSGTVTRVTRGSNTASSNKNTITLAGFFPPIAAVESSLISERSLTLEREQDQKEPIQHRVRIIDPVQVHDGINQGRLIDVIWPDENMRIRGGKNFWKGWVPEAGMEGPVVHKWVPNHPNSNERSTFDRTILLVKIDDKYVPISESGVQDLGAEV